MVKEADLHPIALRFIFVSLHWQARCIIYMVDAEDKPKLKDGHR